MLGSVYKRFGKAHKLPMCSDTTWAAREGHATVLHLPVFPYPSGPAVDVRYDECGDPWQWLFEYETHWHECSIGSAHRTILAMEPWAFTASSVHRNSRYHHHHPTTFNNYVFYQADFLGYQGILEALNWKKAVHMEKWMSRGRLRILDITPVLLSDMTNETALACGMMLARDGGFHWKRGSQEHSYESPREAYAAYVHNKYKTHRRLSPYKMYWEGWAWEITFKYQHVTPLPNIGRGFGGLPYAQRWRFTEGREFRTVDKSLFERMAE